MSDDRRCNGRRDYVGGTMRCRRKGTVRFYGADASYSWMWFCEDCADDITIKELFPRDQIWSKKPFFDRYVKRLIGGKINAENEEEQNKQDRE
jgi:hypothetical protein